MHKQCNSTLAVKGQRRLGPGGCRLRCCRDGLSLSGKRRHLRNSFFPASTLTTSLSVFLGVPASGSKSSMRPTSRRPTSKGLSLSDCARLATAFSLGAITRAAHNLLAPEALQAYFQQVSIHTWAGVPRSVSP